MIVPSFDDYQSDPNVPHAVAQGLARSSVGRAHHNVETMEGATFTDRFARAALLAHSDGGVVVIPPRLDYTTPGLSEIYKPTVSVIAPGGSASTLIKHTGNGACLPVRTNPVTVQQAGQFGGFTIDGTDADPGSVGVHTGDIIGAHWNDLVVRNYTAAGSTGMWFENRDLFTERNLLTRVWLDNNNTSLRLSHSAGGGPNGGNSFGYNRFLDLRINVNSGQTAFVTEDDVVVYSGVLVLVCNVDGTGTVFDIRDTSQLNGIVFAVGAEQTGGSGGVGRKVSPTAFVFGYGITRFENGLTDQLIVPIPGRTFADGSFNSTDVMTSASGANFLPSDYQRPITNANVPGGTTVAQWLSFTQVRMSAAATGTAGGQTVVLGAVTAPRRSPAWRVMNPDAVVVGFDSPPDGQLADWIGTGAAVNVHPAAVIDTAQSPYATFGMMTRATGPFVSSPFVAMYDDPVNSAVVFYRVPFDTPFNRMQESARITPHGGVSTAGLVEPPAITNGAALGTAPPTAASSGNSIRGTVSLGTGTAPAAGLAATVTFLIPYNDIPEVQITPMTAATVAAGPYVLGRTAAGFTVAFANAPTATQPVATYIFSFRVSG